MSDKEVAIQRAYYTDTADKYDDLHLDESDEHYLALMHLEGFIQFYGIETLLDIGAGTGRVARHLKNRHPELKIVSLEPVAALREQGYQHGLSPEELIEGDATALSFPDGAFDMVCEFGTLHHIKQPERAVAEMLRVSKKGIFISDSNNFGQGGRLSRWVKQGANALGLWGLLDLIKTRGKGYSISEGDGLYYSYSVFNNYKQIAEQCDVFLMNTRAGGADLYRSCTHVCLAGLKKGVRQVMEKQV
ncbi:class I SAM-dependent methyltransferase [Rhodovibrionaceae bacterium A322]